MAIVTLIQAKAHCRVTHDLEDSLIQIYLDAADDWIKNFLNRDSVPNKSSIKAAALLIIEDLYFHRAAQTEMKLYKNHAVESLLYPYRVDMGF